MEKNFTLKIHKLLLDKTFIFFFSIKKVREFRFVVTAGLEPYRLYGTTFPFITNQGKTSEEESAIQKSKQKQ